MNIRRSLALSLLVLGAIAARTTRIRLGSAVTVLSSDDPVRVFQRYSTLNAISGGQLTETVRKRPRGSSSPPPLTWPSISITM